MTKREEAMEALDQLPTCVPRDLFTRLDELHKGEVKVTCPKCHSQTTTKT